MVSCIEIETASLVFAIISLFSSCMASLVCTGLVVHINVLMAVLVNTTQRKVSDFRNLEIQISNYGVYFNVGLGITLSIVLICLIFSIILTKGLLSKKAHLVKAYFIYGVIANTVSVLFAVIVTMFFNVHLGLLNLFGCFLYCIILILIKSTYEKLSTKNNDQLGHKNTEAEKPTV